MSPLRRRKLLERLDFIPSRHKHRRDKDRHMGGWGSLVFVIVILTMCISPNIFDTMPNAQVGTEWEYGDVLAPDHLRVPDSAAAEQQRRRLIANHTKVFVYDHRLDDQISASVGQVLDFLADDDAVTSVTPALVDQVRSQFSVEFSVDELETLKRGSKTSRTLSDLETIFRHLLTARGVSADKSLLVSAMRSNRADVVTRDGTEVSTQGLRMVLNYPDEAFRFVEDSYVRTFNVDDDMRNAYAAVVRQWLRPNITLDNELTEGRVKGEVAAVDPHVELMAGSVVIKRGDRVTPLTIAALAMIDQYEWHNDLLRLFGGFLMVLLTVLFVSLYVRFHLGELSFGSRSVLMVALPVVFAVSFGRVLLNVGLGPILGVLGAFALPAGMVAILGVMLFGERLALVLTVAACVLFGVSMSLSYPFVLLGLIGGFAAIASLRNLQQRRDALFSGLFIGMANCVAGVSVILIMFPNSPDLMSDLGIACLAGLVNGFICYMLAVAALPVFERLFQVTTDMGLLELTGAHNELLEKLEDRAPGTLQHSMNVAALAEVAAEAVGAHYLLVRAGAYFHDIGKMVKPTYFTENQTTPEQKQVHSKLSPAMSTLIIKNHVKDGVDLAREFRLPERVIDFIPEHHGTSLIKYFYVQALKKAEADGSDEVISEDEYRYPGPKPRSVETAILMLADTVEAIATSRFSGNSPDEVEIRRAVHEAVTQIYEDRQLSNSPLTFRDLEIIKDSFVRVLQNRFHQRVKYPVMPGKGGGGLAGGRSGAGASGEGGAEGSGGVAAPAQVPPKGGEGTSGAKVRDAVSGGKQK